MQSCRTPNRERFLINMAKRVLSRVVEVQVDSQTLAVVLGAEATQAFHLLRQTTFLRTSLEVETHLQTSLMTTILVSLPWWAEAVEVETSRKEEIHSVEWEWVAASLMMTMISLEVAQACFRRCGWVEEVSKNSSNFQAPQGAEWEAWLAPRCRPRLTLKMERESQDRRRRQLIDMETKWLRWRRPLTMAEATKLKIPTWSQAIINSHNKWLGQLQVDQVDQRNRNRLSVSSIEAFWLINRNRVSSYSLSD